MSIWLEPKYNNFFPLSPSFTPLYSLVTSQVLPLLRGVLNAPLFHAVTSREFHERRLTVWESGHLVILGEVHHFVEEVGDLFLHLGIGSSHFFEVLEGGFSWKENRLLEIC